MSGTSPAATVSVAPSRMAAVRSAGAARRPVIAVRAASVDRRAIVEAASPSIRSAR